MSAQTDGKIPSAYRRLSGYGDRRGGAYANCINMTEGVVIPSTVKRVEREAFSGCTSVRSISLPDNGVTICAGVFRGCTALNSVHIPASVKADGFIGESPAYAGVFARCSALRECNLPEKSITAIPKGFFLSCTDFSVSIYRTVWQIISKKAI
ncbi:MAG: leucine-rich repeat domain-containing protein [Blautia massiliensis (ex Durand et al. 2017)]